MLYFRKIRLYSVLLPGINQFPRAIFLPAGNFHYLIKAMNHIVNYRCQQAAQRQEDGPVSPYLFLE